MLKTFNDLAKYVRRHRLSLAFALLLIIVNAFLTTYTPLIPGRVIDAGRGDDRRQGDVVPCAGAGALMALLEDRRKKLAAEGLFARERKRPLYGSVGVPEMWIVDLNDRNSFITQQLHFPPQNRNAIADKILTRWVGARRFFRVPHRPIATIPVGASSPRSGCVSRLCRR